MTYNHTEWRQERLDSRAMELQVLVQTPHSEARKQQLQHELDCIAFEVGQRIIDRYIEEQHEIAQPAA